MVILYKKTKVLNQVSIILLKDNSISSKVLLFLSFHVTKWLPKGIRHACFRAFPLDATPCPNFFFDWARYNPIHP